MKTHDHAVAAGHSVDVDRWQREYEELMGRIAPRFGRVEPRRQVRLMVRGLVAELPRTNCWTVAENAGQPNPYRMQHLLSRASWDQDGVRDDLRGYVIEHLGDPDAVLVIDETGDVKKGEHTVGVQRQYTGTAGRIENAQVAVYLTYATDRGHAFIDRTLYLPKSWTDDEHRCADAGVPAGTSFKTKPKLAGEMIGRALDAGAPARWVAADEVYGNDRAVCELLRGRGVGHVLAVASNYRVDAGFGRREARSLVAALPAHAWQIRSAGQGSKGLRWYEWALIGIDEPGPGEHRLLIRRSLSIGELAFYRCWTPEPVPLAALVRVAGTRWRIEENFQAAKGLAALDQHQVRTWTSWHRWTILAMLAHAFLAVLTVAERTPDTVVHKLIPLTCNEIRHLFVSLIDHARRDIAHLLCWSRWRRQHQAHARACHYRRREAALP